jgi:pyridoxine 5-phosphate synthase
MASALRVPPGKSEKDASAMTVLSVNVNKIALLRNSRDIGIPSVTRAAQICIDAGAGGITVHPRPDQRHIRPADVYELAEMLTVEFNIEGNPYAGPTGDYPGFMEIVRRVKPAQCTLVPDDPNQLTSDHGWNLSGEAGRLVPLIDELRDLGVRVSLFMNADCEQIPRAAECHADRVELYTEPYARAFEAGRRDQAIERYAKAAKAARDAGLGVNAGHDLNLENLGAFCSIPAILEVSIGHALVCEAIEMGLSNTVKAYREVLSKTLEGSENED